MSLPSILSFCKQIRVESRNFVYLNWFSLYTLIYNLLYHDSLYCDDASTVQKRRDPAILDREELFLQLEIEEIFFSEEFSNPNFKDHS